MNVLAVLMAILTLSLSSFPCCNEDKATEQEQHLDCDHSSNHEDGPCDEPCSPFFTCGSCSGFSIQEIPIIHFTIDKLPTLNIEAITHFVLGDFFPYLFKPPRI